MSVGPAPFYMLYEQQSKSDNPDSIDVLKKKEENVKEQDVLVLLTPVHI